MKQGEIIEISTWDAYGGIISSTRTFQEAVEQGLAGALNPVTGPIYIEEAEPGDTLAVEIIDIELPEWGGSSIIPGFGALEGWLNLMEPRTRISYIQDNKIIYKTDHDKVIELEAEPFIGTIGVSQRMKPSRHLLPVPTVETWIVQISALETPCIYPYFRKEHHLVLEMPTQFKVTVRYAEPQ